jgi:hypothetical protein
MTDARSIVLARFPLAVAQSFPVGRAWDDGREPDEWRVSTEPGLQGDLLGCGLTELAAWGAAANRVQSTEQGPRL